MSRRPVSRTAESPVLTLVEAKVTRNSDFRHGFLFALFVVNVSILAGWLIASCA